MARDTLVDICRCIAEDTIDSINPCAHTEQEVHKKHAKIKFDEAKLPGYRTNETV